MTFLLQHRDYFSNQANASYCGQPRDRGELHEPHAASGTGGFVISYKLAENEITFVISTS
jgi:hypothetical protein